MIVNDFVHGLIEIPDVVKKIIQTPLFQRLKKIKQLGLMYKQLPRATYTRYDHSIGTYYLTSRMLNSLERNSIWFQKFISNNNECNRYNMFRQAVEIAALLHDIGHGPFSHLWEHISCNYNHEKNGEYCVDGIFKYLGPEVLPNLRFDNNYGIELVKALILGEPKQLSKPLPLQYTFLFEIVHNKQCELDIDKLDYLKRDSYFANGIVNNVKYIDQELDCIFFEAHISDNGRHIEYRYQDYKKIYELFELRTQLHRNFYRMPNILACDYLLKEIILSGDYTIDGTLITKIRATSSETYLKFVDDEILKLIEGHELFSYFNDVKRIKEIDVMDADNEYEYEFSVQVELNGAGNEMPPDTKFHFYGDPNFKEPVERQMEHETISHRFRLT